MVHRVDLLPELHTFHTTQQEDPSIDDVDIACGHVIFEFPYSSTYIYYNKILALFAESNC